MTLARTNAPFITTGAFVTVEATEAVRLCASGNPRIERGELLYSGRVLRVDGTHFGLQTTGLGRLNTIIIEWASVLDAWEHQT